MPPKPAHGKHEALRSSTRSGRGGTRKPGGTLETRVALPNRQPPGGANTVIPYASWLSSGDNAWQMTAATLVGLMSIPALAVLYGGLMQKRWSINSMMLTFAAFAVVLVVWVLWAFKMGFGHPIGHGTGFVSTFLGKPG